MKCEAMLAILLTSWVVDCQSFLYPELASRTTNDMNRVLHNSIRKYHTAINKLAAREPAGNDTDSAETDNTEQPDSDASDDDDEGSGSGQKLELRDWKLRRQFNSAMGMGIDTPAAQPQTNAYDVHGAHQGAAPWESNSHGHDDGYYYYYYYDDEAYDSDIPLPKKHKTTNRQLLKLGARRILSVLKRPNQFPPPGTGRRSVPGSHEKKYTHDNIAEMNFRMGQPRRFSKWKTIQK